MYHNHYDTSYEENSIPDHRQTDNKVATIKVVGIGGAGCNAVNRMIEEGISHVDFIAVNTDLQVLNKSLAPTNLQIGKRITRGLGAGAKPEIGEKAAQEDQEAIKKVLEGADMVFITAGMGGGTGTGASPVFAKIAKELNALTVAVVTLPFEFEGVKRFQVAQEGIQRLKEYVDTMLVISNTRILDVVERKTTIKDAFKKIDEVLKQAVEGISNIIGEIGLVNVDFADVKTVLSNQGEAIMGVGVATGENRAVDAVKMALENPLIENTSFRNAGAMLVNIIGDSDFTMREYNEASSTIYNFCRSDAELIIGVNIDDKLKDKLKVIIIATDFSRDGENNYENTSLVDDDVIEDRKVVELKSRLRETESLGEFRRFVIDKQQNFVKKDVISEDDLETPTFIRRRRKMG